MTSEQLAYDNICYYTLAHGHPSFIHQHVVDAFAAQDAGEHDKPIRLTFALIGLYLHVEENLTGREVQLAHMKLARVKQTWPTFTLPANRGAITASAVEAVPAGPARDLMIHEWCVSVWDAFRVNRQTVIDLLRDNRLSAPPVAP